MNIDLLIHGSQIQSERPVATLGPVPQSTTPTTHDPKRLVSTNSHGLSLSQIKRSASQEPLPEESPAKKQSKWTPEEDNLTIELRGQGMKWDDIAKRLPGRSSISCRLRYQNYLEKRAVWDEEKKDKLGRLYARFKDQMWQKVATEMGIPWRSAESMHWQLGEQEMRARANALVFQLHPSATSRSIHAGDTAKLGDMPLQKLEPPPRQISAKVHPSGVPTVPVPDKKEGETQPSDEPVGRRSEEYFRVSHNTAPPAPFVVTV
ncbi:hypothetical protein PMIN03_012577 [Paraphaeosphaeria minitans]